MSYPNLRSQNMPPWFKSIHCWQIYEPEPNAEGNATATWKTTVMRTGLSPMTTPPVVTPGSTREDEYGYFWPTQDEILLCDKPNFQGVCERPNYSFGTCGKLSTLNSGLFHSVLTCSVRGIGGKHLESSSPKRVLCKGWVLPHMCSLHVNARLRISRPLLNDEQELRLHEPE